MTAFNIGPSFPNTKPGAFLYCARCEAPLSAWGETSDGTRYCGNCVTAAWRCSTLEPPPKKKED